MRRRVAIAIVVGVCLAAATASAQPSLNLKRVVSIWPTIEVYFTAACDGAPGYFTKPSAFRVFENGEEVDDFTLLCPDNTMHICLSVALVFDASGSMTGSGQAGAKAAGNAFIDVMDGISDEAAILWFNEKVTVAQGMTASKSMLSMAINRLPSGGFTAAWDGMYEGLQEVIRNGANQGRAVIALTDGYDGSSTRTPAEVVALAQRNRIHVFTIGLGTSIETAQLQMIADLTGGRFYQTQNAGELTPIYQEISRIIFLGNQECVIQYQATCMDGSLRTVDLQLPDFCGGSVARTKAYRAPRDTATFAPLTIRAGSTVADRNATVKVPVMLVDSLRNEFFQCIDVLGARRRFARAAAGGFGCRNAARRRAADGDAVRGRCDDHNKGQGAPEWGGSPVRADVHDCGCCGRGYGALCRSRSKTGCSRRGVSRRGSRRGIWLFCPVRSVCLCRGQAVAFSVACHPNPVRTEVEVRIDGAGAGPVSVTLVDALGRVQGVARDLAGGGQVSHRFAVGDLPPGVYFIIAATRDAVQMRKFVKVE
jgi:Mg-chelatase subunit ChlD